MEIYSHLQRFIRVDIITNHCYLTSQVPLHMRDGILQALQNGKIVLVTTGEGKFDVVARDPFAPLSWRLQ